MPYRSTIRLIDSFGINYGYAMERSYNANNEIRWQCEWVHDMNYQLSLMQFTVVISPACSGNWTTTWFNLAETFSEHSPS